jgi:hypothetical protein
MPKQVELRLLPPRLLPLTPEREQAAVRLLTELLLDEVARRQADASSGIADSGSGVVVRFPVRRVKARKAA